MNELWAREAVKKGEYTYDNVTYLISREPRGFCDGCHFHETQDDDFKCPGWATKICTTGGNILKIKE